MPLFAPFTPSRNPRLGTPLFLGLALLTTCSVTRGQGPAPLSTGGIIDGVQCKSGGNGSGMHSLDKLERHER
jgi:hypothetical protein